MSGAVDKLTADGVPNLDCLETDDLRAFYGVFYRPIYYGRRMFPHRPARYTRVTRDLAHYAMNKVTARNCRLRGQTVEAVQYDQICDRIYRELPDWARW